jgi:hypothetical protein
MLEVANRIGEAITAISGRVEQARLADQRQIRRALVDAVKPLATIVRAVWEKEWPELLTRANVTQEDARSALRHCDEVLECLRRANVDAPGLLDDCAEVYEIFAEIKQTLSRDWPWHDDESLRGAQEYFQQGGEGTDVRDILNDLSR